jgi:hypothetical protein
MHMDDTLARWLQLREQSDATARAAAVTRALTDTLANRDEVRVLDLGTGTGSNIRYLVPHLPSRQHWVAVDREPALLARLCARMGRWAAARNLTLRDRPTGCSVEGLSLHCDIDTRVADLSLLHECLFEGRDVVTASALFDLSSESWLRSLAAHCRDAGAAALFALTYNGWSTCTPVEPEDEAIRDLLNHHQRTDKGLGGIAAGPDAAELATRCFAEAGFQTRTARTDWCLAPAQDDMQRMLVDGWADAALELARISHGPLSDAAIEDWRARRHRHIDAGESRIAVGHVDLAAWLPA